MQVSVVGPSGAGKSTVANYLASENDDPAFKLASTYVPTVRGPHHTALTNELRSALGFLRLSALSTAP